MIIVIIEWKNEVGVSYIRLFVESNQDTAMYLTPNGRLTFAYSEWNLDKYKTSIDVNRVEIL